MTAQNILRTFACVVLPLGAVATSASAQEGTLPGEDYAEIQGLYYMYNYAFDSSDGEAYASVFTEDGEFVVGGARRSTDARQSRVSLGGAGMYASARRFFT